MQTKEKHSNTKRRILEASLKIISTEGFCKITIRKVASLADVNIAAINYHFGSKEQLINDALHSITEQLLNSFSILSGEDGTPEDRLRLFLNDYTKTLVMYPDIIKYFIMQSISEYCVIGEYELFLQEQGYDLIKNTLKQIRPDDSETTTAMRIMQMLGGLAFPVLVANRIIALKDFDYFQDDVRSDYAEIMIENIISR